jgi:hypothetical protein
LENSKKFARADFFPCIFFCIYFFKTTTIKPVTKQPAAIFLIGRLGGRFIRGVVLLEGALYFRFYGCWFLKNPCNILQIKNCTFLVFHVATTKKENTKITNIWTKNVFSQDFFHFLHTFLNLFADFCVIGFFSPDFFQRSQIF